MALSRTSIANDSTSEIAILGRILSNGKEFTPATASSCHVCMLPFLAVAMG